MMISITVPVHAKDTSQTDDNNKVLENANDLNEEENEYLGLFSPKGPSDSASTYSSGVIAAHLTRSGNTTGVDLILSWNGGFPIKAFRFTKLTVKSTNVLGQKIYATIYTGDYVVYRFTSGYHVYKTLKRITIPKDVTKVRVEVSSLMVQRSNEGDWLSGILKSATVTIK